MKLVCRRQLYGMCITLNIFYRVVYETYISCELLKILCLGIVFESLVTHSKFMYVISP